MSSVPTRQGAPQRRTDYGEYHVERIRHNIEARDEVLAEARRRRDRVRSLAERYPGALRSFSSGSVAHGTVRKPVKGADSGMVLDRRTYPELGPDGLGTGPCAVVSDVAAFIHGRLIADWPTASCEISKRAIVFQFHAPLGIEDPQEDPSVDLVVGMTRDDATGLPNLGIRGTAGDDDVDRCHSCIVGYGALSSTLPVHAERMPGGHDRFTEA
jgi:hypothetical protein